MSNVLGWATSKLVQNCVPLSACAPHPRLSSPALRSCFCCSFCLHPSPPVRMTSHLPLAVRHRFCVLHFAPFSSIVKCWTQETARPPNVLKLQRA
eukprot:4069475-Pleurochrysis_carterae.AAC.1